MSKPREFSILYEKGYDNPQEIVQIASGPSIERHEKIKAIELTPQVSKCIALHDEMLAVLKSTLESLLPYDKEGKMSAVVIAVCDVIKKAEQE